VKGWVWKKGNQQDSVKNILKLHIIPPKEKEGTLGNKTTNGAQSSKPDAKAPRERKN